MVKAWKELVTIPTYEVGEADKNPMFFEKRVYQGSSGVVYPNPVIEKLHDEKVEKEYVGLFIENKYLKIMILPELGGRVQMAFDKIRQRHFVYYNQVIKPALVGLCGPWISGGIEFNWPQHHRPSTFDPVDYLIEDNDDGSKTVWVNEVERMFRTKGMAGFTLHPDKAYLEIKAKLYNRTLLPQTFLWWANPAVKVNDHYQSVFPPDVNAVFDHGKRDVSSFPIATGTYYKVNYAPGTDISRYKNIPVPTSYMAIQSEYDFVGGYEHDTQSGLLHVADHHVSPGKKQWTWGHSDFGKAWDRNLTDEDGPYIELMTGVFTDNQPDFTWLMPYEEKSFTQYFMPYRELGVIKNASRDLLLNIEKENYKLVIKIFATSIQQLVVKVFHGETVLLNEFINVSPEKIFEQSIPAGSDVSSENILIIIKDKDGNEKLRYEPLKNKKDDIPKPAQAAQLPQEILNTEQLFLTGQHLEQYRHATYSPVPYYEEALRRDPGDIRNNNALGLWYFRRGQFQKSELYFRKAIETATQKNPNPYDGEPYYNLGVCLKMQGNLKEAYDVFFKAAWSSAWQDCSHFSMSQIEICMGSYEKALEHIEYSIDRNSRNNKAYVLKAVCHRKLNQFNKAMEVCELALRRDKFNLGIYFEQYLILKEKNEALANDTLLRLIELSRKSEHNFIEYALDYSAGGLWNEANALLQIAIEVNFSEVSPMVWYYLGWIQYKLGNLTEAQLLMHRGSTANSSYCFPNRLEDIEVLQLATKMNSSDSMAPYYLGNLWYDKRQYTEALSQWELSASRNSEFPTVFRNLGIAYFNKLNDPERSLQAYEKAYSLNVTDARILMELDQLYKRLNRDPQYRLNFLEENLEVADNRDDLYLERAALHNIKGDFKTALSLIERRKFHPWEGGEGKVSGQYVFSLIELSKQLIEKNEAEKAIELLTKAQVYPENLGEGKLFGARENDIFYWLGCAHEMLGDEKNAYKYWQVATDGDSEPGAAIFYNDQQPDKIFYQGLAWIKLGEINNAVSIFNKLVKYGLEHLNDDIRIDYFAVSLPDLLIFEDDLKIRNIIHCNYMMGLGYLGLKDYTNAESALSKALSLDCNHLGATTHFRMVHKESKKLALA